MNKNQKKLFIAIAVVLLSAAGTSSFGEEISFKQNSASTENIKNISFSQSNPDNFLKVIKIMPENRAENTINIVNPDMLSRYLSATDKFTQCNISAAYKEFQSIVDSSSNNDFTYLSLAYRFSNIGLFSLAQSSLNKIKNTVQWKKQIKDMTSVYFPEYNLSRDEEIFLAQMYSDIYFNNLAFESIKELTKKDKLLKKSDYANYLLSLAYYETKEFSKAQNAINKAISINPENTNYLKLKTQILCDTKQFSEAIKIINTLIAKNQTVMDYENGLVTLREYILARFYKDEKRSKYHLANYLILNRDYARAIKELNQSISKKKNNFEALTLIGDVYYQTSDYPKALDYYNRSYKINKKYPKTLIGLGNVNFYSANYKEALNFYSESLKKDKTNTEALINSALTYKMLAQEDRAYEFLTRAIELDPNSDKAYYALSLIFDDKRNMFLNKTLEINPLNIDAWLDLAMQDILSKNFNSAQINLDNAKLIDSNSYKYYYYQGLLDKNNNDIEKAVLNFKKSNKINPNYVPVIKELNQETNI